MSSFLYGNTVEHEHHLSVGIMARDAAGDVLVLLRPNGVYTLPTGTQKPGETLEQTVARELREETGARGKVLRFLGGTTMTFTWHDQEYHKTFLWHEVQVESTDPAARDGDDDEAGADLVWLSPASAMEHFRRQGRALGDWDFSEAVSRLR